MKKKVIASLIALSFSASMFSRNITFTHPTDTILTRDTTAVLLDEAVATSTLSHERTSPLRLKKVTAQQIRINAVGRTFPEILSNTSSVYATRETGSFGDAQINIRGFKQENISILLNGIPISGLTSGNMFWNNWMGLSDATSAIQLQKGIGSSMISDNSVGGTINIITDSPRKQFGIDLGNFYTSYGNQKVYANIHSGDLGKGWAFNLSGSYTWGSGYVECTDVNAWSYLASVSKKIGRRHSLLLTALGSPEVHSQRSNRLTYEEIEKYGTGYNKNWGWDGNRKRTISRNNYHKPYFTLNHSYKGERLEVSSAAYLAIGNGGGYFTESKGKRIISFIGEDGHIDWGSVRACNSAGESQNIMSDFMAGHTQFGVKTSAIIRFSDRIFLDAGLHYQLYNTWEKEQITDLLGGTYWIDRGEKKKEGDFIRTYNGRNMNYLTAYALGSFTFGPGKNWILKTGVSLSGVTIRRWDRFNYEEGDIWSDLAKGIGGSLKAGLLYNIDKNSSLYLNGGFYSRAPYAGVYFASNNNEISRNVRNENNLLGEIGYRLVAGSFGAEITGYAALWQNKTVKSNPYRPVDNDPFRFMISGLDAFHYGGELEAYYRLRDILRLEAFASIGDWRWKNNVDAILYDPYTDQPVDEIHVYSDNLHVGDAPQTQIGASFDFHLFKTFDRNHPKLQRSDLAIGMDWNWNDRFWSDFDPVSRTDAATSTDPYRIPSYHLMNMKISWNQQLGQRASVTLFVHLNNLLNTTYVERGKDGRMHDRATFSGYWGAPRNYNFGIRLNF